MGHGDGIESEVKAYRSYFRRKLKRNWYPPKDCDKTIQVAFQIRRDGSVSNLRIERSSSENGADYDALEAVRKSVPFKKPPNKSEDFFEVFFNFGPGLYGMQDEGAFKKFYRETGDP